jgi:hypothetical protein
MYITSLLTSNPQHCIVIDSKVEQFPNNLDFQNTSESEIIRSFYQNIAYDNSFT